MKDFLQNPEAPRAPDAPAGIYPALAWRARQTGSAQLVALETAGLAVSFCILMWMPSRLALALPFVALSMLGLWGAAEHAKRQAWRNTPARALLSAFQIAAATAGTLAAAAALYLVVGRAIGTVIS